MAKITCVYTADLSNRYRASTDLTQDSEKMKLLTYTGNTSTGYAKYTGTAKWGFMNYGSNYYCTRFDFSGAPTSGSYTLAQLKSMIAAGGAISKITLSFVARTDNTGRTPYCFFGMCSGSTCTLASGKQSTWTATTSNYVATITKDVTSWGFPNSYAYASGGKNNKNVAYGYFTSATLTVEINYTELTLSYNANGGSGAPSSQTIKTSSTSATFDVSSLVPTYTGHEFKYWYLQSSPGTHYVGGDQITIKSNSTLYAYWDWLTYIIRYDPSSSGEGLSYEQTKTYDVDINLLTKSEAIYTRTGYDYDGWSESTTGVKDRDFGELYSTNSNLNLYPHWVGNTYNVIFNSMGGSPCEGITVIFGSEYGTLPEPTKSGYLFRGWYAQSEGGTRIVSSTIVSIPNDHELYAQYDPDGSCDVHVKVNGDVYDGEVFYKLEGELYSCEVWTKINGEMYKGS